MLFVLVHRVVKIDVVSVVCSRICVLWCVSVCVQVCSRVCVWVQTSVCPVCVEGACVFVITVVVESSVTHSMKVTEIPTKLYHHSALIRRPPTSFTLVVTCAV